MTATETPALPVLVSSRSIMPAAQAVEPYGSTPMELDLRVAKELANSDIVPKTYQGQPANILVAIGLGRALGLEPAASLYGMHVIEGTPSPTAKVQAALVRRAGHKLRILENNDEQAVVEIVRYDDPDYPVRVTFSIEDARAAGYLNVQLERWVTGDGGRKKPERYPLPEGFPVPCTDADLREVGAPQWAKPWMVKRRDNWHLHRSVMLHHRAVTRCVGMACPEVVSGLDFEAGPDVDDLPVADPVATIAATPPAPEPPAPAANEPVDAVIVDDTTEAAAVPVADSSAGEVAGGGGADGPSADMAESAGADSPADPPADTTEPAAPEQPTDDPNVLSDGYGGDELAAKCRDLKLRQADVIQHAQNVAESLGIPEREWPGTVPQIAKHPDANLRRAVAAYVNAGGQV